MESVTCNHIEGILNDDVTVIPVTHSHIISDLNQNNCKEFDVLIEW